MNAARVGGIGFFAPGLPDWPSTRAFLREEGLRMPGVERPPAPAWLAPTERRRLTPTLRLALGVAAEAMGGLASARALGERACSVFAAVDGDMDIFDALCTALAQPGRPVSPTQFHNSVHNAPAGYWHQAAGWHGASVSLSGGEGSFALGLLDALTRVDEGRDCLLVCYDNAFPEILDWVRPGAGPLGCALWLRPVRDLQAGPILEGAAIGQTAPERLPEPQREALRLLSPAGAALGLLHPLATGTAGRVALPMDEGQSLCLNLR
ncbi:MAG: beta-ketoacyl synthase chain length factor [Pseudomonadota bacterium]